MNFIPYNPTSLDSDVPMSLNCRSGGTVTGKWMANVFERQWPAIAISMIGQMVANAR